MKLSNFTARFLTAILSLGIGLATSLFTHYGFAPVPAWANHINATCVQAIYASSSQLSDYSPDTKTITIRPLRSHPEKSQHFQEITITDDLNRIFEATPPTPLDYAVILQKLYDQGYRSVVLTTRMTWDKEPTANPNSLTTDSLDIQGSRLSEQALSFKLAQFDRAVIAVPVTRGPTQQTLPPALKRALIPFDQVHGSHTLIPTVNQVPLPTSITGGDTTLAGFHRIESTPAAPSAHPPIPLLAHWKNKGLIPSIELLTIMSAHHISPAELTVTCGKHIQLGKTGPIIPIDDYGQTTPPFKKAQQLLTPIHAETAISATNTPSRPANDVTQTICLLHATGEKTSSTNLLTPDQLAHLFALCETVTTPGDPTHYRKLPIGFELILIFIIAIIASRFATLPSNYRNLAFTLSLPSLIILLIALMETNQQWFSLIPPIITVLTAYLITSQLVNSERGAALE
jgi:hypothetical protein